MLASWRKKRPYLKLSGLPKWVLSPDLKAVVHVMNSTRFCHHDRFKDKVSKEILGSMKKQRRTVDQVALSVAVRYKGSPKALAPKLAGTI